MATFILLSSLTDEGAKTLSQNPDRVKQVNAELQQMGARVTNQWAVLGPYDFVNVVEAPDNATIAKISAALSARGTIRVLTMAALPIDDFIASLKK